MFRPGPPQDRRQLPDRLSFGPIRVDLLTARVWNGEDLLHLEPKAFDLLLLLAANRGRIVEKEEIFERLWEETYVSDSALTRVVSHLRHELGDHPDDPSIIETVRTRGYRFLPEIVAEEESETTTEPGGRLYGRLKYGLAALAVAVATIAVALLWQRSGEERPLASATPIQITAEAGYSAAPSFSPDGNHIVYVSDAAGGLEVFVRPLAGGPARKLTGEGCPCFDPVWSPDGRWIAYEDAARGGIWLVDPGGGHTRQLTTFGVHPAIAPNGEDLVFSDGGSAGVNFWELPGRDSMLWLVELPRGEPRQLTQPGTTAGGTGQATFSPDGEWVVFTTATGSGGGLWRLQVAGGAPEPLIRHSKGAWFLDPVVTPDGSAVMAVQVRNLSSEAVVRVPMQDPDSAEPHLTPVAKLVNGLALSPDGRHLAFSAVEVESRIEEVELTPDLSPASPPRAVVASAAMRLWRPRYSPDGEGLVYRRLRQGAERDIVVADRQGLELWSLLDVGGREPVGWLANGDVLVPADWPGEVDIVVDIDARRERELPPPPSPHERFPEMWPRQLDRHPDRAQVLFTGAQDGARELFLWHPDEPEPRQLTELGGSVNWHEWTPGDRGVTFQLDYPSGGGNEVWKISFDDGVPERLDTGDGHSWSARASPDGEAFVYTAYRSGTWYLAIAGVGMPERFLDVPAETTGYLRWPDWSPAGDRIVYERTSFESEIFSLELPAGD